MVVELSCPLSKEQYSISSTALGFVELTKVVASKCALEEYFKNWLLDCNNDHEYLRLIFPREEIGKPDKYAVLEENEDLVLKCDVFECIINPMSLPFGNRFLIQTDLLGLNLRANTLKSQGNYLPIYELIIRSRLSINGVCESLLFGMPLRLYPTQCWRLEGSKILENQQYFSALCKELMKNEEFLLAQLKPHPHSDPASGYFILIPGEGSLLLKSIAPGEIILPQKNDKVDNIVPEEVCKIAHCKITSTLNAIPFHSEYEPKLWKSGLYTAISSNLMISAESLGDTSKKDSKPTDPPQEVRRMPTKAIIKSKGPTPNVLVKEAILRTNYQGRGQRRT
ncbi:meiosis 1 arrest protein-like [Ischnura elegans]|uniref:meiosis 1 arrest protein-like n=1 Tax=Ischnura elegans TaxID=197161 RepID=UPI001ED8B4EA|nr:meiosis 1 arrest protein-like [Ischnura elegans]